MSTLQLKDKSTSADPRLVVERTSSRPGTLLTAFSRGGDGHFHLVDRHHAVIHADDDPRKVGRREHGDRERERLVDSDNRQRQYQKNDRLGVPGKPIP